MSMELHIERLVLDASLLQGERPCDVRAAVQRELAQWLRAPGATAALRQLGHVATLRPAASATAHDDAGPLATRIAAAVGRGLGMPAAANVESAGARGGRHV